MVWVYPIIRSMFMGILCHGSYTGSLLCHRVLTVVSLLFNIRTDDLESIRKPDDRLFLLARSFACVCQDDILGREQNV